MKSSQAECLKINIKKRILITELLFQNDGS